MSATLAGSALSSEVQEFAVEKGGARYLDAVIDLARHSFPTSTLSVSLEQDAEDETHQYIAFDIATSNQTTEELLAGQRNWSAGLGRICPARDAVYFVLGWR